MIRLTLKNLAAHKMRLLSTALAVLLGVAFMAGTLVFNDTLTSTFDDLVSEANAGVDGVVRAPSPSSSASARAGSGSTPVSSRTSPRSTQSIRPPIWCSAMPSCVGPDGDPVGDQEQAPAFGLNWVDIDAMNPYDLVEGTRRRPTTRSSSTATPQRRPATARVTSSPC